MAGRDAKENLLLESTRTMPNKHSPLLNFPREAAMVEMVENKAEEAEVAELAFRLAAPIANGSQKPSMSRECSSQVNCCQQLNLSNSEMISPTVIDTINKSTTLNSNFMYDCDIEVKSDSTGHILGVGQINCKIRSSKPIHSLGESELSENIERGLKQTLKDKVEKSLKDIFAKLKSLDSAEEIERTELNAMLQEFLLTQDSLPSSPVIRIAADIGGTSVKSYC
jgi:hypothetical protein